MRIRLFVAAVLMGYFFPLRVLAEPATPVSAAAATPASADRDFSFVVMPIPVSNPAVGNGLAIAGMALYRVGGSERPWVTAAGGLYTDSKSWGALVGQKPSRRLAA